MNNSMIFRRGFYVYIWTYISRRNNYVDSTNIVHQKYVISTYMNYVGFTCVLLSMPIGNSGRRIVLNS